jgi:ABC-type ATPase with predicted acetyltransferase domain
VLAPITVRYAFRPAKRSLATGQVADLFGLADEEPEHTVAAGVALDARPGDLVLFTGPSGSGKSSLLRAVAAQLGAVDAATLALPDAPLIDALPGPLEERLAALGGCGLSEARLLLRTPAELSEGQRYRFRLAYASQCGVRSSECGMKTDEPSSIPHSELRIPHFIAADEFTATLDRTLAKVVAFNLRKLVTRTGVGVLAATTHEDVAADLNPDVWVRCFGDGRVEVERRTPQKRPISFANELRVADGTRADWPHFARWHYRSHALAFVTRVVVLWHGTERVGGCVFGTPAASLALRTKFFGLSNPRSRVALSALNAQLWVLQRVVLHPTYRGAGIAASFVREACVTCPVRWIETLSAMGHANPFFERAGFVRVGVVRKDRDTPPGQYGSRTGPSADATRRNRFSDPVYYVFDNRQRTGGPSPGEP